MSIRARSLCWLLLFAAAALPDQVVLKNGDQVTGAIVKMDGKTLTLKSDLMGTVNIAREQVKSIFSAKPLHVVLPDGRTVETSITTTPSGLELKTTGQIVASGDIQSIRDANEQRAYERLLNPAWDSLWGGTATFGFAGTAGNARTRTLTGALNAGRITNTDKTTVRFNLIQASALVDRASSDTADAIRAGWAYNRNFSPRLFVNTFNDYEYDRFQNLDLRFVLGSGLGYTAVQNGRGRIDFLGGAAYNREKFGPAAPDPAFSRNSAEAYWGNDYKFSINSSTSVFQNFRMFNSLSKGGEYRVNFDLGASTKIAKWIIWNLGFNDRYLSNPLPGRKTNDLVYTTGIGITFARE